MIGMGTGVGLGRRGAGTVRGFLGIGWVGPCFGGVGGMIGMGFGAGFFGFLPSGGRPGGSGGRTGAMIGPLRG